MYTTLGIVAAQQGKLTLLAEIFTTLAKETRAKEKGCLEYRPYISSEDSSKIIVFAEYVDQEAFQTHRESPYFKAAQEQVRSVLDEKATDILDGDLIVQVLQALV